ncbi:LacI family DNA-binding transcriptional regulator [Georgenia halophila]|uniref:LacI family DNA-binding transcriptional regulator n=1 Tax=Georgenia halophila TaxID=620889 RepID=A0ABP8LJ06_9MICO
MAVNLRDVARLAGVSVPTASRVLSGSDYPVAEDLRARVAEAAEKLDYVPNAQAQALLHGNRSTVGVLVGDVGDPYFSEIVNGVHTAAAEQRLLVTICNTERDVDRELEYFRMLQAHRTGAVIVAGSDLLDERYRSGMRARIDSFCSGGGRVAAIGAPSLGADRVEVANAAGGRRLAEHLVGLGHRRIGVLAAPATVASTRERVAGLREVVEAAGGVLHVRHGAPSREEGHAGTPELMAYGVTALVGTADQMALGALARLREQGLTVPGEVSVAGFNDITAAQDAWPALTSVRLPLREMGAAALRLATSLQADAGPRVRRLGTELVVRASTGPLPRDQSPDGGDAAGSAARTDS